MDRHVDLKATNDRDRRDLLERIDEIFPDPGWPRKSLAAQDRGKDFDSNYINKHFVGKRWQEISDEELQYVGADAWAFNFPALAYFLPAFLQLMVRTGVDVASVFGGHLEAFCDQARSSLSKAQIQLLLDVWKWHNRARHMYEEESHSDWTEDVLEARMRAFDSEP